MDKISELRNLLNSRIAALELEKRKPVSLYEPMAYVLENNAKRIRPLMVLLAFGSVSELPENLCLDTALAVELLHNFTLIHDDIMDQAPVRRGKPTVHIRWNTDTAILSGDALFALTYPFLISAFPDKAAKLVHSFSSYVLEICEGQMLDMELPEKQQVTIHEYIEMIRQKTAVLIGGSLAIGALAGDAEDWIVDEYYRIGEALGIGFQIQDDLLDAFGEPEKFGKQTGGDIIENKKTFLLIRAFEKANADEKIALNECLKISNSEEKVQKVLELFTKLGIKEETEQEVKKYFLLASNALENLPEEFTSEELKLFIQHIFFREH